MSTGALCECGCGEETRAYDPRTGVPRRFICGHQKMTEGGKAKLRSLHHERVAQRGRCQRMKVRGGRCKAPAYYMMETGERLCEAHCREDDQEFLRQLRAGTARFVG